jgi:hypothetical protein
MPHETADMSLHKGAQPLSGLGQALRTLIDDILNDRPAAQHYFNHSYDKDPATNGGAKALDVDVSIYYQPATQKEYDTWQTIDEEGYLSGRRRLAVRIVSKKYSFYTTNHPQEKPGLRTNVYGVFTPIDPKR